jgi:hypothetical protein
MDDPKNLGKKQLRLACIVMATIVYDIYPQSGNCVCLQNLKFIGDNNRIWDIF